MMQFCFKQIQQFLKSIIATKLEILFKIAQNMCIRKDKTYGNASKQPINTERKY